MRAFTQAYINKDINIAKEYANKKVADAYESRVQREVADEINSENRININKDGAYRQHPMLRPDEPSIGQGDLKNDKLTVARERLASEINIDKLNDEQRGVYDVFVGDKEKTTLQGNDLNDLYTLERGSRKAGGKKIMIKHAGIEKTGGLTNDELLGVVDVVRSGRIAEDSFEQFNDRIRYAYDLKENGVKFRVVIDEYNDGKKVFDYYSDRNFVNYEQDSRGLARTFDPHSRIQVPNATDEIISQKGNLINEEAKNSTLPNGVSGIGDNASGAGGRQGGDEEILRQSGRNTSSASQTKQTAKSYEQMEQRSAFKTDGDTDATASSKQMVEEQGSGNNEIKGENFIIKESPAPKSDLNVKISVDDWVRELGGINANKQIKADLTKLYEKHKELFAKPSDVFRLIKAVKENPTFFYNNNEPNTALIGKILDNGKLGKIGIQKDYDSEYLKLNHATYSSKTDKENKRLLRRNENSHLVGSPTPTQLTLGKATEPTADGAKALLDEIYKRADGKDAHIPLHTDTMPAGATGANARSSADESIIPQKEINAKTINANSHIASGFFGGTLNSIDEDGNFNPDRFAAGFLAGLAGSKAVAIAARKMTSQLYNKILGAAKKMPQMAKDNPKLLGKLYANGKDVSINSFAGEKAITANVGKLDQAKAMLEKGADEVEIWQKTGWFKDKDGAWKFEIGDSKARLNPNFKSGGRLGELLEHEELFKAYPELKDVTVVKIKGDIPQGASASVKDAAQREKRGIYNVAYNDKSATLVRRDL